MGTTTNNGWPTPVATDLVKDGWEAIKDLGDAIDTTLGVYAPSTPGLTLINTTSFSAVASQSFNNVFSANYDSYKIITQITGSTTIQSLGWRLRASGTDLTSSIYKRNDIFMLNSSSTVNGGSGTGDASVSISNVISTYRESTFMDITNPFNTQRTVFAVSNNGAEYSIWKNGYVNDVLSYDGFSLTPQSGTITGSVSVYGYNK